MNKEDNVIYWKDVEKKMKWQQRKEKAKQGLKDTINWISENKAVVIASIPLVIEGSRLTRKLIDKGTEAKKAKYIYDPSLKQNIKLKKAITGKQQAEISKRHQNGEKLSDIYREMGILK